MPNASVQRRAWLLIPPIHATFFALEWLFWQLAVVEANPSEIPSGFILGYFFGFAVVALFASIPYTILLLIAGYAPRKSVVVLIAFAGATISLALFRSGTSLGVPDRDLENWEVLFLQHSFSLLLVTGFYASLMLWLRVRQAT